MRDARLLAKALYVGIINLKILSKVEVSDFSHAGDLIFAQLYRLIFKPKGYKEYNICHLYFGEESLSYHKDGAVIWFIKYDRLSHIELP